MNSRRSHPPLAAAATRARRTRTQMRMWREGKKKSLAALALRGSGAARRGALLATTHAFKLYAPTRHPPRSWSPTRVRIPVAISRATPPPPPDSHFYFSPSACAATGPPRRRRSPVSLSASSAVSQRRTCATGKPTRRCEERDGRRCHFFYPCFDAGHVTVREPLRVVVNKLLASNNGAWVNTRTRSAWIFISIDRSSERARTHSHSEKINM